jgi:hypothetical protein
LLVSPEEELEQPPFYYLALALLAAGLAVCAAAALGCWATYMPGYVILTIVSYAFNIILFNRFNAEGLLADFCAWLQRNISWLR